MQGAIFSLFHSSWLLSHHHHHHNITITNTTATITTIISGMPDARAGDRYVWHQLDRTEGLHCSFGVTVR